MCHTMKLGDGCFAKGVGGCGGNLLQANVGGRGAKGFFGLVRYNVKSVGSSLRAYNAARSSF
jgi:hypothetical protein